jgi:Transcription factor WhiB
VDVLELLGELARLIAAWSWMADGLCLEYADDVEFFPGQGGDTAPAKNVCARCLVREECAAFAVAENIRHGIWGGLSERERRATRGLALHGEPVGPRTREVRPGNRHLEQILADE